MVCEGQRRHMLGKVCVEGELAVTNMEIFCDDVLSPCYSALHLVAVREPWKLAYLESQTKKIC